MAYIYHSDRADIGEYDCMVVYFPEFVIDRQEMKPVAVHVLGT